MYVFFWVFPRRLIKFAVCRRFGTLYQFHLQRLDVMYEVWCVNTLLLYLLPPHLLTHSDPPTTCCPLPIGPATFSIPRPLYKYHVRSSTTILHTLHPALEDGTDIVFRNVGKPQSDAGEIPKRIHTRYFSTSRTAACLFLLSGPVDMKAVSQSNSRRKFTNIFRKIWGFHVGEYWDCGVLNYNKGKGHPRTGNEGPEGE